MERDDHASPVTRKQLPVNPVLLILFVLAVSSLTILLFAIRSPTQNPPSNTPMPMGVGLNGQGNFHTERAFQERIEPVLITLQERDDDARQRAIAIIQCHFDRAKSGASAFADAIIGPLNSVKTTWLAGKGVFERWWYKDPKMQPVANHVRWNYEQNVTSGPKIRDAVVDSINQLERDFRANRNDAIQAIASSLKAGQLPVNIDSRELDKFCQQEVDTTIASVNSKYVAEKAAEIQRRVLLSAPPPLLWWKRR
jgi:hypothetical protein